jgi:hypothetical protein
MKIQTFDYSVNLLDSILWQYDEATHLVSLVTQKQNWVTFNQTQFWTDWYNNIFNLLTANTFGLVVWSLILNLPLFILNEVEDPGKPIWGFNAYIPRPTLENSYKNFGRKGIGLSLGGNFSVRGKIITLTTEEQRFLLRLRYYQLSNRCDVTDVNIFLDYLIRTSNIGYVGTIYMLDNLDMTITYNFTGDNFPVNLLKAIQDFDVFPRPAGVDITYTIDGTEQVMVTESGVVMISEGGEIMVTQ